MASQILLGCEVALTPFAGGSVGAHKQEGDGGGDNDDEGDNESHTPCDVSRETLVHDKRVEDCRHQEIGDTSSRVTKASGECVGRSDDVLIKEAR